MPINKWFFDFHLLEQGWLSTIPYREDSPKLQPPSGSIATLRMIEFDPDDKQDMKYKVEVAYVDPNRVKVAEFINKHGLPKAILVNCWAQKQELEQQLTSIV